VPYFVHVCPECCFAAFEEDYDSADTGLRRYILSGELRPEEIIGGEARGALRGSSKYMLAARCYKHDPATSDSKLAEVYLRGSWCARAEALRDRERQCQAEAALHLEQALNSGSVEPKRRHTVLYLVGELYRRLGMFDVAVDYFDQALHVSPEICQPRLQALIERQLEAARARRSENMVIRE